MKNFINLFTLIFLSTTSIAVAADDASAVKPILIGSTIPSAKVSTIAGKEVNLAEHLGTRKSVVVFYRGGWCPYCNTQLQELRKITTKLQKMGYHLIAISPDRVEELQKSSQQYKLDYELISDSQANAMKAFGIGFKVDRETRKKYNEYGIDLSKASGEQHFMLPVPAVFMFDKDGRLVFQYVNPDYKVRLKSEVLLAAARAYSN